VRKLFGVLGVALVLCFGAVLADEVKGRIKDVDTDKKEITVVVDGKDVKYMVADDAKLPGKGGKGTLEGLKKRVDKAGDKGVSATLMTEKKGGKEWVTEIQVKGKGKGGDKAPPPQ
jgi:hypothetical protein